MPRNGSGSYSLPAGINPVVTQTLITSNWANQTMNDLAAAITQSLSKDGQTVPTGNLPMGGFRHTGVGDPVLRDNYDSLGYVQDGKHVRLTGVSGVNQIAATLPGGATGFVVGQIVQLIPTASNTGAVTLNINSTGFFPIVTDIGSQLAAGNMILGRTYLLSFTGAAWQIISASGGVAGFAQAAMTGWDRPANGIYPSITFVNPTTVFVPGGTGRVVKPSTRDLSGVREVTWVGQNVTIQNVAVAWQTILGVNSNGQIIQLTGNFSGAWARDYIMLGSVVHINGQINEINTVPTIYGDMTYAAFDTATLLKNTLVSGGKVLPNAASPFHIDLQAGLIFSLGADSIDLNDPNASNFPATFDLSFFPVTGLSGVGAATQNVPVTQYDPLGAGVVTAIPGAVSTTTIHRLFFLAGEYVFLYGQAIYADLNTALGQIGIDDASLVYPAKLVNATLLCYIVAQKNCTDLKTAATARIVAKGGTQFSIGTAGSISEAPINGLTYGRKDAAWNQVVPAPVGPQATVRQIYYYTNTFARFSEGLNDTPEGGANTGSDFEIRAYNDAGTLLGTVLRIDRATQAINVFQSFTGSGLMQGAPLLSTTEVIATTNFRTLGAGPTVLGNTAAGNIFLRPNGPASTVGQVQVQMDGNVNINGQTNVALSVGAVSGIATVSIASSSANAARLLFGNSSFGEMGRIVGSTTNTLLFQTGASPVTRLTLSDTLAAFTVPVTAPGMTSSGLVNATGAGSGLTFTNRAGTARTYTIYATANVINFDVSGVGGIFTLTEAGAATFNSSVTSSQIFQGAGVAVVLATTGAGTVYLRPNGAGSGTGELLVASSGAVTLNGTATNTGEFIAANYFATTNGNAVFAPVGSGNVILRPQGPANATGQLLLTNGGELRVTADYVATGLIATLAATGAGSVRLRPNGVASATGELSVATTGVVNHGNLTISTAAVLTTAPITITGAFTATGRQILMTNTDTSTGSLFGFVLKAGTGIGSTISDYAPEYNGLVMFTGKLGIEGPNNGIAYSALGAAGTHTWYQGAARTLMMTLGSAGLSLATATGIGFYGTAAQTKKTVTGSRAANAALTSLLTALAGYGLITDSSSA